jgi:hypothetical protein
MKTSYSGGRDLHHAGQPVSVLHLAGVLHVIHHLGASCAEHFYSNVSE